MIEPGNEISNKSVNTSTEIEQSSNGGQAEPLTPYDELIKTWEGFEAEQAATAVVTTSPPASQVEVVQDSATTTDNTNETPQPLTSLPESVKSNFMRMFIEDVLAGDMTSANDRLVQLDTIGLTKDPEFMATLRMELDIQREKEVNKIDEILTGLASRLNNSANAILDNQNRVQTIRKGDTTQFEALYNRMYNQLRLAPNPDLNYLPSSLRDIQETLDQLIQNMRNESGAYRDNASQEVFSEHVGYLTEVSSQLQEAMPQINRSTQQVLDIQEISDQLQRTK